MNTLPKGEPLWTKLNWLSPFCSAFVFKETIQAPNDGHPWGCVTCNKIQHNKEKLKEWTPTWWVEATHVLRRSRHGVGIWVGSGRSTRGIWTRKTREDRVGIGSRILMKHDRVQVWTRVTVGVISSSWPAWKYKTKQISPQINKNKI